MLDGELAQAIAAAADEVAAGKYDGDFPIDVFQTGSGTSSNMNTNEVSPSSPRAPRPPAATRWSTRTTTSTPRSPPTTSSPPRCTSPPPSALINDLIPALELPGRVAGAQGRRVQDVVKSGRTHLMDATPVTLGQEFGGYAAQVRYGIERIHASLPRVAEVPLGGTAVGTGINTPAGFPRARDRAARRPTPACR